MRHIMLLLFRDAPGQLSSYTTKYTIPWDLMPIDITHITVKTTLSTALQCIAISRWLSSLNLMSSVQDATCGVNL